MLVRTNQMQSSLNNLFGLKIKQTEVKWLHEDQEGEQLNPRQHQIRHPATLSQPSATFSLGWSLRSSVNILHFGDELWVKSRLLKMQRFIISRNIEVKQDSEYENRDILSINQRTVKVSAMLIRIIVVIVVNTVSWSQTKAPVQKEASTGNFWAFWASHQKSFRFTNKKTKLRPSVDCQLFDDHRDSSLKEMLNKQTCQTKSKKIFQSSCDFLFHCLCDRMSFYWKSVQLHF